MRLIVAAVVPPLAIAGFALHHPASLTAGSAHHWQQMHTYLIPIFPLLALGPWLVARAVDRHVGVVVGIAAYTYATFYTALDILAGVGGGALKRADASGLRTIFGVAKDVETIGGVALVVAAALSAGAALRVTGWLWGAAPAMAVVSGSYLLWQHHIFRPWGVVAMLLLAFGWGAFAVAVSGRSNSPATGRSTSPSGRGVRTRWR